MAQFKPQKPLTFADEARCSKNDGLCDTLLRRQYACPISSKCHSGTDVQTNNANEQKRPPLDAGNLSQPTPSQDVRTWDDYYPGRTSLLPWDVWKLRLMRALTARLPSLSLHSPHGRFLTQWLRTHGCPQVIFGLLRKCGVVSFSVSF